MLMNLVIVCEFIKNISPPNKWIKRLRKILLCQNFELYSVPMLLIVLW